MSERHPRGLSAESSGMAPGRARLGGRRILVVGGGQRVVDAATDPVGNGRASTTHTGTPAECKASAASYPASLFVNTRALRPGRTPYRRT